MNYLTSLRGLAALLVVFFHIKHYLVKIKFVAPLYPLLANGYLAVDFFLVLSGFILSYKYADEFKTGIAGGFRDFMAKRFARIYPLHAFVMLCFLSLPLGLYVTGRGYDSTVYGATSFFGKLFLVDLWCIGTQLWNTWNVPSWTISGEFFAYLMFPVLAYAYQAFGGWQRTLLVASAVVVLAGLYRWNDCPTIGDCIGQLGLLRCLVEFVLGMFVWFLLSETRSFASTYFKTVVIVSVAAGAIMVAAGVRNYVFVPALFASTIYGLVGFRSKLHDILELPVLVFLGEISYSVYLTHLFLRDLLFNLFLTTGETPSVVFILFYVGVTLLFSVATYRLIEMPFRKRAYAYLVPRKAAA